MKIKTLTASLLAVLMLCACSKSENEGPAIGGGNDSDVAYLSINVQKQVAGRSSVEKPGSQDESELFTLYAFTFNNSGMVAKVPGTTNFYTKITGNPVSMSPDAFKISASSEKLLLIANPGSKLEASFGSINATSTFASINAAITGATEAELTDPASPATKGFTMINSGDDSGTTITDPLVSIVGKIVTIDGTTIKNEAEAKAEAEKAGKRVVVKIERLASKLEFKLKGNNGDAISVEPSGAKFEFGNWTVDAVNSTFYPFAKKTMLSIPVTGAPSFYAKNFYTHDPNFLDNAGIGYTTIDKTDDYSPILVAPYTWMAEKKSVYCIENTMEADEQKFENATRLVIKGKYYPDATWSGDWFSYAGTDYATLDILKAKYTELGASSELAIACNAMYNKLAQYASAKSLTWTATDFLSLVKAEMDLIPNGGEVVKDGKNPVIRWYQQGLCYYYYEIRHDDVTTTEMAFGKYGVVRNNWYSMTLGTVRGPGSPWYPDIENPGPGDPDPQEPIDAKTGYLGITIDVAPWIFWEREIGI